MRIWLLVLLAALLYMLTWIDTPGAAVSFNAYDMAEWASLHPVVPGKPHPLWLSFSLRLPLVLLVWMCAVYVKYASSRQKLAGFFVVGLLWVATMPPPEVIIQRDNANYQQQALLFLMAGAGIMIIFSGFLRNIWRGVVWMLAFALIVSSLWGVSQAQDLMIGFSMPVMVSLHVGLFCMAGLMLAYQVQKRQGMPTYMR